MYFQCKRVWEADQEARRKEKELLADLEFECNQQKLKEEKKSKKNRRKNKESKKKYVGGIE